MKILVTGGLGFIGAITARLLLDLGYEVEILDYGLGGVADLPECLVGVKLYRLDVRDFLGLKRVFAEGKFDAVVHFAGRVEAGLSIEQPWEFFSINSVGTLNVLECMRIYGVGKIVFSSTAAVYGLPEKLPILESDRLKPINVYGESKLMAENWLRIYAENYGIGVVALRYFNACGAWPEVGLGEWHENETHLIPRILWTMKGRYDQFVLYGDDYDTKDGTCVRDYVHVRDLANGHVLALEFLKKNAKGFEAFNLGNSVGFSVRDVIEACEGVVGMKLNLVVKERRVGDPDVLIADNNKAIERLGWRTEFSDLERIVRDGQLVFNE